MPSPPVALFVIAKDISIDAINAKLQQAYRDALVPGHLHLITDREYPGFNPDGPTDGMTLQGTIPPIAQFSNSFSGKNVDDAAEWLQNGPESMFLERDIFAVLDDYSEANNTITICKRKTDDEEGREGEVDFYPHAADHAGNAIGSIIGSPINFDDYLDGYQMGRRNAAGKPGEGPDLSRGKPYFK